MASERTSDVGRGIARAAVLTVGGILASRVLGVVRQTVISAAYGADASGVLRVALHIPDLIFYLVAGGAIRTGFLPVFTDLLNQGDDDPDKRRRAWWLFSAVLTGVTVAGLALVLLASVAADWLIMPLAGRADLLPVIGPLVTPSDEALDPAQIQAAVNLTRILLPAQIFLLMGGLLAAALNALKRFEVTSIVPAWYNLVVVIAVLAFGSFDRLGLSAAAWGLVVAGLTGNLAWQALELWRVGRSAGAAYRPALAWRDADIQRVFHVAWPIMLGLCAAEVNLKVSAAVITRFGPDVLAWFDNASRLARLPDGLFGAGLGIALFPYLSDLASRKQMTEFRRQSEQMLRLAFVFAVPSATVMAFAPLPLTRVLYGYGRFVEAVPDTAALLPWCAISIVPVTLQVVLSRAFYATENSRTPLWIGLGSVLFGVVCNIAFGTWFGLVGPPLAMGLTTIVNTVGLLTAYHRHIGLADGRGLLRVVLLSTGAAVAGGLLARLASAPLADAGRLPAPLVALAVQFVVYFGLLKLLRVAEADDLLARLRRRRKRS